MAKGKIAVKVGAAGIAIAITGASVAATSAATLIVATGAAAGVGLIGYGLYRTLCDKQQRDIGKETLDISPINRGIQSPE